MAPLDDILEPAPATVIGVGVLARAVPALASWWAPIVKAGIRLFLEAELGTESDLMGGFGPLGCRCSPRGGVPPD